MKRTLSTCFFCLVFIFNSSAQVFETQIGEPLSPGQFRFLSGLAIDPEGNVFVTDNAAHTITKFNNTGTALLQWGGLGNTDEKFNSPRGIAVDAGGNVYVIDEGNSRIQKFNNSGTFITKWTVTSTTAIAVDAAGNVFVTGNNSVRKFSGTGTLITEWGSAGTFDGQFNNPSGITVDASGNVFVSDRGNNRIQKFNNSGFFLTKWGSGGSGDEQFNQPCGLAVDAAGNVYVTDFSNSRIQKFSNTGTFINKWGVIFPREITIDASGNVYVIGNAYSIGNIHNRNIAIQKFSNTGALIEKWGNASQFNFADGVAVDLQGNIFVADYYDNQVKKFDSSGTFISKWGDSGVEFLDRPSGIAVDNDGNVFVTEYIGNKIKKFSNSGEFITKWGSSGSGDDQFSAPNSIALDATGNIYVCDAGNRRILKFSSTGTFITKWGSAGTGNGQFLAPKGIAIDISGNVYVADTQNNRVQKFSSTGDFIIKWGSFGSADGQMYYPRGIAVDVSGDVYVGDANNSRIQKFNSTGSFLAKWGSFGLADGQFYSLNGLAADFSGNVYVSDEHKVQKFYTFKILSTSVPIGALGTQVILTGYNFHVTPSQNQVKFNGVIAMVTAGTTTSLTVTVPAGATTGKVSVTKEGLTTYSTHEFVVSPFIISTFSPVAGVEGDVVTIHGSGFSNNPTSNRVKFNEIEATVTSSTATSLVAVVPAGNTTGKISVTINNQTTTSSGDFETLKIGGFVPTKGIAGATVTISGTGFNSDATVKFNGVAAPVLESTPTTLVVTVPQTTTTGAITVSRQSNTVASSAEFLVLPHTITSFTPTIAISGSTVTLTGSGYSSILNNNDVKFNGVSASVTETSPTQIKVVVPSEATSGKITVTTWGETSVSDLDFKVSTVSVTDQNFPAYYNEGTTSINASVTVNTIAGLQSAKFLCKGITSISIYKADNIPLPTSNTIVFSIPPTYFNDPIGLTGYFVLTDNVGNEIVSEKGYTYINYPGSVSTPTIPDLTFGKSVKNYQIISIPLKLKNNSVSNVFDELGEYDNSKWRLYSYSGNSNTELNTAAKIETGKGYWLIVKDKTVINPGEGNTVEVTEDKPFTITLYSGGNLIGNPYNFDISWSDVLEFNNSPQGVGNLIQYSNGVLAENNTLERYRGAFVRNTSGSPITIKIPVNSNSIGGRKSDKNPHKNPLDSDSWTVNLILDDGLLRNELGGFGMHPHAKQEEDEWDEAAFPFPGASSFKLVMKDLAPVELIKDIVATAAEYSWSGEVISEHGIAIYWHDIDFGTSNKQLVLEADSRVELIDMHSVTHTNLPAGKQRFKIHYGDPEYIKAATPVENLRISHAYPNPLKRNSQSLSIALALPEKTTDIQITFTDMLGKQATLSPSAHYDEGRHIVEWRNDFTALKSGIYLLRLLITTPSGNVHFYRKILVE